MAYKKLLAKTSENPDDPNLDETLFGHCLSVFNCAKEILYCLGETVKSQFELSDLEILLLSDNLLFASLLHDIGKANDHFQGLIRNQRKVQAIRHEVLSALCLEKFVEFDTKENKEYFNPALYAILSHHYKVDENNIKLVKSEGVGTSKVKMLFRHEDVRKIFHKINDIFDSHGLCSYPTDVVELSILRYNSSETFNVRNEIDNLVKRLKVWYADNSRYHKIIAILKSLLVSSDTLGSIPFVEHDKEEWIKNSLIKTVSSENIERIKEHKLAGKEKNERKTLRNFQLKVANIAKGIGFVEAGCGNGKTLAAYLWAQNHSINKKLFFCYPTTGTTTEGFSDYLMQDITFDSRLIHSRAEVDIERLLQNPDDEERNKLLSVKKALRCFDVPFVACTVDTVLSLMTSIRSSLVSFPAFVNAAFVFDEVHSYDDNVFGALIEFLKFFKGAHVLLMTATLPKYRKDKLIEVFNDEIEFVNGDEKLETAKRYEFHCANENSDVLGNVNAYIKENKKILWVGNTVNSSRASFEEYEVENKYLYHSRFRYKDRASIHRIAVDQFKKSNESQILFATQVAEMSLDLDADLLITEIAPIPSLIQRLGRLRRNLENSKPPGLCIFIEPDKSAPYEEEELELARKWINELSSMNRVLSQRDLAEVFEKLTEPEYVFEKELSLLDNTFLKAMPLREAGYTISVILEKDIKEVQDAPVKIAEYLVPIPYRKRIEDWKKLKRRAIPIAPSEDIKYSEITGAEWIGEQNG